MITRIEIDGFKSFRNFAVNLRPFQVLIGANGVGKSNLFDAIVLLSDLARAKDDSLYEAFRQNRGEIGELFTLYPDGTRARHMRFAVEMLVAKQITDSLGATAELSSNRLRYELHIERRLENGFEHLYVVHESLTAIVGDNDPWSKIIPVRQHKDWIRRGRRSPYLSTDGDMIFKHQDGRSGTKQATLLGKLERTVLSTINSAEYPTAYTVRQEMLGWRFLQFDPLELRTPSSIYARSELLPDGSNLAAMLYRMWQEDEFAFNDVSRDMANFVTGIRRVFVEALEARNEYLIKAETQDGSVFSSRVLSDGTLRLLALVALRHDPHHQGVLCFEEPENGVQPERLKTIVKTLKSLATDFDAPDLDEDEIEVIPRQVLINTHSPGLMSFVDAKDLLFVYLAGRKPNETRMAPVDEALIAEDATENEKRFTRYQVTRFLEATAETGKLQELGSL